MNYIEIKFSIDPLSEGREICMAFLSQIPFETFQDSEDGLIGYILKNKFLEKDLQEVIRSVPNHRIYYSTKEIEQVNWNSEWESNFDPIEISENCVIRAPFHKDPKVQFDLIIMPKMSFGTGHHSTTILMMRAILVEDLRGLKVIGSSVLSSL